MDTRELIDKLESINKALDGYPKVKLFNDKGKIVDLQGVHIRMDGSVLLMDE